MKKIFLLLLFAFTGAFAQEDVVKFTASIQNRNSDSLTIRSRNFTKILIADSKGDFTASFAVQPGLYKLNDGQEEATIYLKNGFDLTMSIDAKMFDETISFKGSGEKENNFLAKKFLVIEQLQQHFADPKDKAMLLKTIENEIKKLTSGLADTSLDENFRKIADRQIKGDAAQLNAYADQIFRLKGMKGQQSAGFDYDNFKGGSTTLEDLKGKYVYIDIWATWCAPCREEIPHLQKLEHDYAGKDIAFVSISIDEGKHYNVWKKMVAEKQMSGIQLFANNGWDSDFIKAYYIDSIPRFILIDPKGKVVDADAKRPSDPALREQLDKLLDK